MTAFVTKVIMVAEAALPFISCHHAYQSLLVGVVRQAHQKCFSLQILCVCSLNLMSICCSHSVVR